MCVRADFKTPMVSLSFSRPKDQYKNKKKQKINKEEKEKEI